MKTDIIEVKDRFELERDYEPLLQKYDFYLVPSLKQLKNKNNYSILHLKEEDLYCVVTGRSQKKSILRRLL